MLQSTHSIGSLFHNRWIRIVVLVAVPVLLYLILLERRSWLPRTLAHTHAVLEVAFSPDGRTIATAAGEGGVWLWDTRTEKLKRVLKAKERATDDLCFSPTGKILASSDKGSPFESWSELKFWNYETGELKRRLYPQENVLSMVFTPDGKTLITGISGGVAQFRDARTGALGRTLGPGPHRAAGTLAISSDGKTLAAGFWEADVQIWNIRTNKLERALQVPGDSDSLPMAFAPFPILGTKDLLATGLGRGILRLWNPHTGKLLRKLVGPAELVDAVAFSPDGSLLAGGGTDGSTRIWHTATGKLLRKLEGRGDAMINSVSFSPDSTTLAVASAEGVRIWRIK